MGGLGSQFAGSGITGVLFIVTYIVFGPLALLCGTVVMARGVHREDSVRVWLPLSFGVTALPFVTQWFGPIGWAGLAVAVLALILLLRGR